MPKSLKILLALVICLLLLQLPWFFIAQAIVNKTQTKTTATLIRYDSRPSNCRPRSTFCDPSVILYPVFEYYDTQGNRLEGDGKYLSEFKKANPLRFIFAEDVGDKVTAYYTPDKPSEVLFMTGIFAYPFWLIPLFLALPLLAVSGVLYMVYRFRR